jgi:hypothetical protein
MALVISRYNEHIRENLSIPFKTERWMHIVINTATNHYAIYAWDTRRVLHTGTIPENAKYSIETVDDNRKPLIGETLVNFRNINRAHNVFVDWKIEVDENTEHKDLTIRGYIDDDFEVNFRTKHSQCETGKIQHLIYDCNYGIFSNIYIDSIILGNDGNHYKVQVSHLTDTNGRKLKINMAPDSVIAIWQNNSKFYRQQ